MTTSINQCRNGFTLIELLCALFISSMVIGLLATFVTQVCKEDRKYRTKWPNQSWELRLGSILEKDVASAETAVYSENGVVIEGYGNTSIGSSRNTPCQIVYRIEKRKKHSVLVRDWKDLTLPVGNNSGSDDLCFGLKSFRWKFGKRSSVDPSIVKLRLQFTDNRILNFVFARNGGLR